MPDKEITLYRGFNFQRKRKLLFNTTLVAVFICLWFKMFVCYNAKSTEKIYNLNYIIQDSPTTRHLQIFL